MRRHLAVVIAAVPLFLLMPGQAWAAEPITIPSIYVYNPSLGALNDYCTISDDFAPIQDRQLKLRRADFRGPCARHDLCYASPAPKNVCDDNFYRDLLQQCDYTFASDTSGYLAYCRGRSALYYRAVEAFGDA